ncbi:hypothetical protein CVT24_003081 [Panaeolus cyanescens]|uniref:F-box domain-containing protein n=1 Tax=Panaeolus cyanescens TaxID=181874 RepID=A0A409VU72_9AGAR|nr:hypothetical protein CVT24_003081 [Panaeolus cyanescens]
MADTQSLSDSSNGVDLPTEIYSRIIDLMMDDTQLPMPGQPLTEKQSSMLRSCSMVCRTFWELVRPQIYRVVVIKLDGSMKHINRFVQLLEDFPDIREFIFGLDFCLINETQRRSMDDDDLLIEDINRYNSILLDLPRVEAVTAQFKPLPYAWTGLSNPAYSQSDLKYFINPAIDRYSCEGVLRICNINGICTTPSNFSKLTLCPSLHTLRLYMFDDVETLEKYWEFNSSIQALCLSLMAIPLSVFFQVPNLERLVLEDAWFSANDSPMSPSPAASPLLGLLGLKELVIEMDGHRFNYSIPQFLSFARQMASARNVKALGNLNRLVLDLTFPEKDPWVILNPLFEDLESLQTLDIRSVYRSFTHVSLNPLRFRMLFINPLE